MPEATTLARRTEPPIAPRPESVWTGSLTPPQRAAVAALCDKYGLDPYLGHINVLGGRISVSYEGRLYIANGHPEFDGYDLDPITDPDIKEAMGGQAKDVMFKATVYRKDRAHGHVGYGAANPKNVAAEHRGEKLVGQLARARAMREALRGAFKPEELDQPTDDDEEDAANRLGGVRGADTAAPFPSGNLPAEAAIGRDYTSWWMRVKQELGLDNAAVHAILGVDSVKQVADLGAAYEQLREAAAAREEQRRQAPDPVDDDDEDLDDDDLDDEANAEDDPLRQDAMAGLTALRTWAEDGSPEVGAQLPVGDGHIRSVTGMAERLGLSPADLATLLYEAFGVEQPAELRRAQARAFLTWAAKADIAKRQARHILMLAGHL